MTHLKKNIALAAKEAGQVRKAEDIWTRYNASKDIRQAFIDACGYTDLEEKAVDAQAEAAGKVAREKAVTKGKTSDVAEVVNAAKAAVKAKAEAEAARKIADAAEEETNRFLAALARIENKEAPADVSDEDRKKSLEAVSKSVSEKRGAIKGYADAAADNARQADLDAREAERLRRGSDEAVTARAAAGRADTASSSAATELASATAALGAVQAIVRANGDIADTATHEVAVSTALENVERFAEQAADAAKSASQALEVLKLPISDPLPDNRLLAWVKARKGTIAMLAAALVATLAALHLDAPGRAVTLVVVAIIGVAVWSFFAMPNGVSSDENPDSSPRAAFALLAFTALAASVLFITADSEEGRQPDKGKPEPTIERTFVPVPTLPVETPESTETPES